MPPQPATLKPPSVTERDEALDKTLRWALDYSKSLPDFICQQDTRRFLDPRYLPGREGSWNPLDTIVENVSYVSGKDVGGKEAYELVSDSDPALVAKTAEALGGTISRGEFGSVLADLFAPGTAAAFQWLRWDAVRGNVTHVYGFRVDRAHSTKLMEVDGRRRITPGYHGLVWIQRDLNVVREIVLDLDIPSDFPLQGVHQVLDYDYFDIGGSPYLLPLKSQTQMHRGRLGSRNEIDFQHYRKYSVDETITPDR